MCRYVNKVAELRGGVRYKGQSLKQVLENLDADDIARQNGVVTAKTASRWKPLRDSTRLLHCMFAGGEELLSLFREMGVSMTRYVCCVRLRVHHILYMYVVCNECVHVCRQELDDPSLKTKRDLYWIKIAAIFNDKSKHNYEYIDTGEELVDSFAAGTCSPKFRCFFPVHKLFANYTALRCE